MGCIFRWAIIKYIVVLSLCMYIGISESEDVGVTNNGTKPEQEGVIDQELNLIENDNSTNDNNDTNIGNVTAATTSTTPLPSPTNRSDGQNMTTKPKKKDNSEPKGTRKPEDGQPELTTIKRWAIAITVTIVTLVFSYVICRYCVFRRATRTDRSGVPLPVTSVLPSRSRSDYMKQKKKQEKAKYKLRQMDKRWDTLSSDLGENFVTEFLHK